MIPYPDTLEIVRKAERFTENPGSLQRTFMKSVEIVSPQTYAQGFASVKPMPDPVTIVLQNFLMRNIYFLIPVILIFIPWVRIASMVFSHQLHLSMAIPFLLFTLIIAVYFLLRWRGWSPREIRISSKGIAEFNWTDLAAVYIVKRQHGRSFKCLLALVKQDGSLHYITVTDYYHTGQLQPIAAAIRDLAPLPAEQRR